MPLRHRTALSGALGAAILVAPVYGQAQDPATNSVGPPVLRDFQLKGETTVRPPPAPPPAPVPAPTPTPPPPPPRPTVRSETPAARPAPSPAIGGTAPPAVSLPTPTPTPTTSFPGSPVDPVASPIEATPIEALQPDTPRASSAPDSDFPWLYILLAALALPLAFAVVRWRRRERSDCLAPAPDVALFADPPEPALPPAPRPWIELEFRPGKASSTDIRASLDYELVIRNVGDAEARNIRTEARMFNAGKQQDSEIRAFFASPAGRIAPAPRPLPPQSAAKFQSVVALAKEDVREVVVQGRRLFIPMVALNVFYEWGEGETGQSSKSYLVGRESQPPAEKMAPFRLDLGPRIYRSVGARPSTLALNV